MRRPLSHVFLASLFFLSGNSLLLTLGLLSIIFVFAFFFSLVEIKNRWGAGPATLYGTILFLFFRRYIGSTLSENLGIIFGVLSLAFFLRGIGQGRKKIVFIGGFLFSLGLIARAGCFIVLPLLVLWALFFSGKGAHFKSRSFFAGGLAAAILLGFLVNTLTLVFLAGPNRGPAFSNFSYSFYGLVFGGDWTLALNNPAYKNLSENEKAQRIYHDAFEAVKAHPSLLVHGVRRAWKAFFSGYVYSFMGNSSLNTFFSFAALAALFLMFFDTSPTARFLLAAALGIVLSVPFVPPWDADSMRAYATTIPLIAAMPAFGLFRIRSLLWGRPSPERAANGNGHLANGHDDGPSRGIAGLVFSGILVLLCFPGPVVLQRIEAALHRAPRAEKLARVPKGYLQFRQRCEPKNFINLVADDVKAPRAPDVRLSDFRVNTIRPLAAMYPEFAWVLASLKAGTSFYFDPFTSRWTIMKTGLIRKNTVYSGLMFEVKYFSCLVVGEAMDPSSLFEKLRLHP
ncbi:MAG: hypothetical protein ABSA30_00695 [Candidatus Aminicenantales bacterium]